MRSSVNGNPAFRVAFTNGLVARTQSDAAISYELENPEYRDVPLDVEFTPAGRIATWRVATEPVEQIDEWERVNGPRIEKAFGSPAAEQVREAFEADDRAETARAMWDVLTSRAPLSDPQIEVQRTKHAYLDAHNKLRQLQHDADVALRETNEAWLAYQAALQIADPIDTELSR